MPEKRSTEQKSRWILCGLYAVMFAFSCWVMANSPLILDDYLFLSNGSTTFRQILQDALHYGNGRLLGNLSAMLLVRYRVAMVLEKSLVSVAVAALAAKLLSGKDRTRELLFFSLTALLFFGVGSSVFGEVLAWTSGFQNYVPPIFFLLLGTVAFFHEEKNKAGRMADLALVIACGSAAQLFSELNSLMNVLLIGAPMLIYAVKTKRCISKGIAWLASMLFGAAVMVAIPLLFSPSSDLVEKYRVIHLHGVQDLLACVYGNMSKTVRGLFGCRILLVLLCVVTLALAKKTVASVRHKKAFGACRIGLLTSTAFLVLFDIIGSKTALPKSENIYQLVFAAACLGFAVCVIALLSAMPKSTEKRLTLCGFLAAGLAIAPMMIVTPFGPRCMMLSYCFLCACVLLPLRLLLKDIPSDAVYRSAWAGIGALAALTVCLSILFTDIGWMSRQQVAYIEYKMKEHPKQIEAIRLPTDYVYTKKINVFPQVYYNEEKFDIEFIYLEFDEWYANRQAEGWHSVK